MLYLGHFSFSFDAKARGKKAQAWHGYFTAVAEAPDANAALQKLDALIRKTAATSELLSDVPEIYLESCVELRSVPRAGFLAHVALQEGESLGSISTTLPDVGRANARSYHYEPDDTADHSTFEAEPFIVLKPEVVEAPAPKASRKPRARKAPAKKR
ncbi:MAG: hypothetical protein U0Q11_13315 [Vicinamibacterales bacterium]